jgi:molybdopterin/thiamine biosynthesis adenylyltransferase
MESSLLADIKAHARENNLPDGTPFLGIDVISVGRIARQNTIPGRQIEILALQNGVLPIRYVRNGNTFSMADQITLLQSRVAVVGLGGLGGHVVEIMARAGVGALDLIDGDDFEEHNLNRQLLSQQSILGKPKSDTAAKRVAAINSSIEVTVYDSFLTSTNTATLLADSDLVVDCLDNIETRFVLQDAAHTLKIPLVSAAIGGQSGHVTTIFPADQGLEMIYGPRDKISAVRGAEIVLGSPPHSVAVVAALEASEVFKVLLGQSGILRNKLLIIDLSDNTFEVLTL